MIPVYRKKSTYTPEEESEGSKILGSLGMAAGAIGGAITGGPKGAILGMQSGKAAGQFVGGYADPSHDSIDEKGSNVEAPEKGAIQRRMESASKDKLAMLKQGAMALTQMPEDVRKEYASPIVQAIMAAEKEKAMGGGR